MIAPVVLALTLSFATPAGTEAAGMLDEIRKMIPAGTFEGGVGDYAIYRLGSGTYRYWRLAVVGRETVKSGKAVWLETTFGTQLNGTGVLGLKVLLEGDPRAPRTIRKAYFRLGAGKTLEIDPAELEPTEASAIESSESEKGEAPKQVEVKSTPAGTFRAVRTETQLGYVVWLSPQVPVFHVVAMSTPGGADLQLVAVGHDAKDTLGEPQAKTGPKMVQKMLDASIDGGTP
jgi:hypothetical protein